MLHLIDDLGFDPIDGGNLDNSWRQQAATPAYCRDLEAAALRRALTDADRSRIAEYRAEEEARIRTYYVLNPAKGFEVARKGKNEFHAFVARTGDDAFSSRDHGP